MLIGCLRHPSFWPATPFYALSQSTWHSCEKSGVTGTWTSNEDMAIQLDGGLAFDFCEHGVGAFLVSVADSLVSRLLAYGPTALHFAAQACSLESLHFLLGFRADYQLPDNRGWLPIHYAAYYDNIPCFTILYRKRPELLEAETRAE